MTPHTTADVIASALKRHGVEMIFAQSLPSAVVLACERIGIRQIAYRQENMGGAMADGYARVSGRVSVVCAQNGPAATLLVPPLAEALKASIPVVALVQDVERDQFDRNAFQDFDQIALLSPCTKWVRRVIAAERVEDYVDAAFVAAASGRPGPAALLLPADLLREDAKPSQAHRKADLGHWPLDRQQPDAESLAAAARLLATAEHPVVLAGGGCASAEASNALSALQDLSHLPVFTTNMGKGAVAETHPLSCGVLGALNGPKSLGNRTKEIMDSADLVLLVGTRTNQNGTDSWRGVPGMAEIIHIDIDGNEVGRNYEARRLVGDAAATLEGLTAALRNVSLEKRKAARSALEEKIADAWTRFDADRKTLMSTVPGLLRPEQVMTEVQNHLARPAIVAADASYSSMWVVGQLRCDRPGQRFVTPRGLAGLGWGLPLAMGAKLAEPDSTVFALVGDGGFAHSWAEMETLVRCNIPLVLIVLNNGILGYQRDAETVKFGEYTTACHFSPVDHAALAAACGVSSDRVDTLDGLKTTLAKAVTSRQPWLIEVMTDPEAHPAISLYDGTLDQRL
ncbi:MAG: acetolactate synthase catalytic subunit [Phyllobacteriaceae bacterium]|nr:acetolactate synthase catalytic subunit [Phyllobacteriaceae bacterium]MBA92340.1 acetolactate synthase catalytic subunit [Phyllobacteriaceae bacterium]